MGLPGQQRHEVAFFFFTQTTIPVIRNPPQNDFRDIELGDTDNLQGYLDKEFDVESHVDNLMRELDRNLDEILDDTSREVRSCIEGNWEPEPSLKKRVIARWVRVKWARLKRGLTSEEAQQLAAQIAVWGASYMVGRAIGYGIGNIYKKLTATNEG